MRLFVRRRRCADRSAHTEVLTVKPRAAAGGDRIIRQLHHARIHLHKTLRSTRRARLPYEPVMKKRRGA